MKILFAFFLGCILGTSQEILLDSYESYLNQLEVGYIYPLYGNTKKKQIAITFDDGPNFNTKKMIDYLSSEGIPATFFINTSNIKSEDYDLYQKENIDLGLHCHVHHDFRKLSINEIRNDFEYALKSLDSFKLTVEFYRPPYGIITKDLIEVIETINKTATINKYEIKLNRRLKPILWSHDSLDWKLKDIDSIVKRVSYKLKPGAILLFHEASTKTTTVKKIITKVHKLGYEFVPLNELFILEN